MARSPQSRRRRPRSLLGGRPNEPLVVRYGPARTSAAGAAPPVGRAGPPPRRRRGARPLPAAPLLAGLLVGLVLAALASPSRSTTLSAPPAAAALVATPGQLTGLALGEDRLPDCAAV